jgi:hypothetical protein
MVQMTMATLHASAATNASFQWKLSSSGYNLLLVTPEVSTIHLAKQHL